jgi:hypothetical protein
LRLLNCELRIERQPAQFVGLDGVGLSARPKGASEDIQEIEGTITLQLDYLEIPALLRVVGPATGSQRFHLFAGPSIGVRLKAKRQTKLVGDSFSNGVVEEIGQVVKRLDFGVAAGIGVDVGRRLLIEGRYVHGRTNVSRDEGDPTRIRTRLFSVMGGVRF